MLDNSDQSNQWKDFQPIDINGDIFKQIFKYSIIPTIVHDMDMNIINANDSALAEFGYTITELLNKSIFELHTEDELDHSAEVLDAMMQKMKLSVETKFKRKDGSIFMAEATPCKYILGDKPIIHVFIQDITERKQTEIKLQEFNIALEAEVKKVEMHVRQISLANKELEEFSYITAHDLKAPVVNLTALMDMINAEKITDKYNSELLIKIKRDIELLHNTVFALNHIISFKTTLKDKKERLLFEKILSEIKDSISEQLDTSKAIIKVDFSKCPEIDYPPLHLKSIVQNLLTNSLKYKKLDTPLTIEIITTRDKGRVCLTLQDNGMGFDAIKYGKKIFGIFKRLHTHVEGQGIGMYIVKSILDAHGGEIEVKSKPNEGAFFKLYLNNKKNE